MKYRWSVLAPTVLMILSMVVSGCAPEVTKPPAATEALETEVPAATETAPACEGDYVLVPRNLGNSYSETANQGAQEAAGELGITVLYQGSAGANAMEQIALLNSLIAQQPCGLAISANDADALVLTGQAAMRAGIPVVTWDYAIAADGRDLHINPATAQEIGAVQIQMASQLAAGDGGQIAILSAASTAPDQNAWIAAIQAELEKPENSNLTLVEVAYGDNDDAKSYNEAQALVNKFPDLEVIIAPTTIGIAAAARAVVDANLIGHVFVTGLGTPNQMREYVKNGAAPQFALWNPVDLGYLAVYAMHTLATGEITAKAGQTFTAGRLGEKTVEDDPELGLNVLLGPPFVYDEDNIDKFDW
jgi:rhamnose transport system substrate-binding protein